jgi:hypothetical protein
MVSGGGDSGGEFCLGRPGSWVLNIESDGPEPIIESDGPEPIIESDGPEEAGDVPGTKA